MPIYHCSIKIIGRSKGRSAIASSAYRSGTKLYSEESNKTFNYTAKGGVIHSEVMLCENAPKEYQNRQTLWNEVQRVEKNNNAQLAREVEVALPNQLSREQQIKIVRDYVQANFVDKGMCADWALHDKDNTGSYEDNPHAHIMLTTRPIKKNGTWGDKKKNGYKLDANGNKIPKIDPKTGEQKIEAKTGRKVWERTTVDSTDWNKKEKAEEWRKAWADECNKYLDPVEQIDHRSYERQGKDLIPQIHEGVIARAIKEKGGVSERCEINREIDRANYEIIELSYEKSEVLNNAIRGIRAEIDDIRAEIRAANKRQEERNTEATGRFTGFSDRIRSLIDRIRERIKSLATANIQPVTEPIVVPKEGLTIDWKREKIIISYQGNIRTENLFTSQRIYENLIKEFKQKKEEEQELIKAVNKPKRLEDQIAELKAERKGLNIFQGKKKKDIDKQLHTLHQELGLCNGKAHIAENKLSTRQIGLADEIIIQLMSIKGYTRTHKSRLPGQETPTAPAQEQKRDTVTIKKDFPR